MFRGKAVTISCTDQGRSERFYEGTLGAERLPGDGNGCSWFRLDALTLSVMPNAERPSRSVFPKDSMPLLWLEVDDIREAHARLLEEQVCVLEYDHEQWLLCSDPDGLLIEIWQADRADSADAKHPLQPDGCRRG